MRCGVGVYVDGNPLSEKTQESCRTHSVRLMTMIDRSLQEAGLTLDQIDCFAVGTGPGSFTGIRIGISTVKGLSQGTGKPVIGVSSLEALAIQANSCKWPVYVMIDARKRQVYSAVFSFQKGHMEQLTGVIVTEPERILENIANPGLFIGSGVLQYQNLILRKLDKLAQFPEAEVHTIKAGSIALLAERNFREAGAQDAASIVPDYVRKSDAEINYPKKTKGKH